MVDADALGIQYRIRPVRNGLAEWTRVMKHIRECKFPRLAAGISTFVPNLGSPWSLQQDSAPSHGSNVTQTWIQRNIPSLINKDMASKEPRHQSLRLSIKPILKKKVLANPLNSLDCLKAKLHREWEAIPQQQIRAAGDAFVNRLKDQQHSLQQAELKHQFVWSVACHKRRTNQASKQYREGFLNPEPARKVSPTRLIPGPNRSSAEPHVCSACGAANQTTSQNQLPRHPYPFGPLAGPAANGNLLFLCRYTLNLFSSSYYPPPS
ncbi:hypothetical protein FHG87_017220 [Trinorchestia longiramus]|nr:hypothetical protein FHG87_017220 [Trinorchestia longiramus]